MFHTKLNDDYQNHVACQGMVKLQVALFAGIVVVFVLFISLLP